MNYEEIISVVQDKFSSNERVTSILYDCMVVFPEWERKERILAVVQCTDEKAVFCLLTSSLPPEAFSDLTIERVIPVDRHFQCEIDNKQINNDVVLCLKLKSRKIKLEFEVQAMSRVDNFVDELYRSIEDIDKTEKEPSFDWLQKYYGTGKAESNKESPEIVLPRQVLAGPAPLAVRESRVKYEMVLRESEFTHKESFTILAATWNVNDKPPTLLLKDWLCCESKPPDIYAIGFQELDLSKETFLFDQTIREDLWCEAILNGIDKREKYVQVERVRLVGMMLIVLIKDRHFPFIKSIACDTVGTGIMGKMGNKGGVAVRLELHNTSLCFVNSHLAAHVEEYERRNQDFKDICNRTLFYLPNQPPKGIKDHDQIYWIGDLNYRITDIDVHVVKTFLDKANYPPILEYDQLRRQRLVNNVFVGYHEGIITFRPTYKYDPGTDDWDSSEKGRAPAWCDRILWRGDDIVQSAYRSHPSLNISDHKPVSATFVSQIKIVEEEKYRKVYEEVIKKLDKIENELIPQVTVDRTEVDFNTVRYLEPQLRNVTIANTGQVAVQFEFIRKLDDASFCKEWLMVEPYIGCIFPGEKCDIQLKIFINKNSAHKMNAGTDQLYDILVLHLEGGKDIFVTVTGTYERSCFGSSIEVLTHLKLPIREVPVGKLVELESKRDQAAPNAITYLIPKEIWFLVDHIYMHGMKEANLFEQPGLHSEIVQIRDWLDTGSVSPLPGSVHSVAEALLLLLESTADPIIPYNLQSVCLGAAANYLQCKQIVMQLPEFRRNVFLYLCEFLQEVLTYNADNGLDAKTLSTLFGAIFLRDTPNQSQADGRTRYTKQALDKKKANFVYHFLVNGQNELLYGRPNI